jgi:hypothetical protein
MATETPRVWFKSISLENVRSFGTKQTINFTDKDGKAARWNVILGDNGTGKTTVLRGLTLVSSDFQKSILNIQNHYSSFLRDSGQKAVFCVDYQIDNDIWSYSNTLRWNNGVFSRRFLAGDDQLERIFTVLSPISLHVYGANRAINEMSTKETGTRASTLLDENASLIGPASWLMEAEYVDLKNHNTSNNFKLVKDILLRLFKDQIQDIEIRLGDSHTPHVFFKTHYGDVRLHELSLGYKTLIAWMVDFAKGLLDRYPNSENPLAEPAVCLVDEIDLHLHPKFQRTIIQFLTDTFPNTQFIVTAHSPLIVQSAGDANIIVLKREGDETVVEADRINVHDWRIDQILSSDLFGGIGGRAPDVEEKMKRRRALLRKDKMTDSETLEFETLEKELGNLPVSESREALKALDIIGQALINQG